MNESTNLMLWFDALPFNGDVRDSLSVSRHNSPQICWFVKSIAAMLTND